ncbi:MAG: septal ring lytic transglycosylase RlpA family protein [Candidatus Neomarinimicrobiota bacterium]|jgi:hypothetical protein
MKNLFALILTILIGSTLLAQEEVLVVVYEKELEGILTSSGDFFSNQELNAGHESLPMGSIVEFTNPKNEKRVEVYINDRIPKSEGMFWISDKAAKELDILSVYPTKVLSTILHKPDVKEVYDETHIPIPTAPSLIDPIKTVSYDSPTTPESSPEAPLKVEEIVEVEKTEISTTVKNPILDGLSENLEMALGDPLVPKSACADVRAYGVHIYTTINSDEAIEASRRLHEYFSCFSYIEKYNSPIGDCYRVIAGVYDNEAEAKDCYNKLIETVPDIFLVEIY